MQADDDRYEEHGGTVQAQDWAWHARRHAVQAVQQGGGHRRDQEARVLLRFQRLQEGDKRLQGGGAPRPRRPGRDVRAELVHMPHRGGQGAGAFRNHGQGRQGEGCGGGPPEGHRRRGGREEGRGGAH